MVRGNQRIARECYSASMKQNMVDNIYMDELDMRDEVTTRPAPLEELEPVQLGDQPEHLVYIGSKLAEDIRSPLIRFLEQNMEVFAWKQEDMGRVNPAVITHKLNVNPSFKSVKQKRRSFSSERQKAINEGVRNLLQAKAIREVEYSKWLAFQCDAHCQEAFTALKTYLSSPPILVSPSEGELLTLYLAVSDFATSAALVR